MSRTSICALAVAFLMAAAPAPDQPGAGPATPPGDPYAKPARPLEERIDPARITENDPPPLPEQVILPMPPAFRIAERPEQVPVSPEHFERARRAIDRGAAWLRAAQTERGAWLTGATASATGEPEVPAPVTVAVTALALQALAQADTDPADRPEIRRGVRVLLGAQQERGAFAGGPLANYITSTSVSALAAIDRHRYADEIAGALDWLQGAQWDQTEGLAARQDWFGGAGYGNRGRPDLSNTQLMLQALYDAGMSPDEPAFQRALAFVSRAQNLRATNASTWAGDDGGFVYTPANGGESMASEYAGEGRAGEHIPEGRPRSLRSYGAMTYAGFKSMLFAGLSADDLRVRAAYQWLRAHWTFEENPGLGQQGLYYYYLVMSRALRVAQQDRIVDIAGESHDWREELIDAIVSRQRPDGSWTNDADRWMEGEPALVTAYALLALEETLKAQN